MASRRFELVQTFILGKKYFRVRGTLVTGEESTIQNKRISNF